MKMLLDTFGLRRRIGDFRYLDGTFRREEEDDTRNERQSTSLGCTGPLRQGIGIRFTCGIVYHNINAAEVSSCRLNFDRKGVHIHHGSSYQSSPAPSGIQWLHVLCFPPCPKPRIWTECDWPILNYGHNSYGSPSASLLEKDTNRALAPHLHWEPSLRNGLLWPDLAQLIPRVCEVVFWSLLALSCLPIQ